MPDEYVLITRIVIAGLLGGIIGAEREFRAKIAGTRTHLRPALAAEAVDRPPLRQFAFAGRRPQFLRRHLPQPQPQVVHRPPTFRRGSRRPPRASPAR